MARLSLALLLACAVAHGEARPPYGGTAIASLPSAPSTYDPLVAQAPTDVVLADLLFDPLYRLDEAGRPVPALAQALPVESPGDLKVPLRAGVHFHDGRLVRPADVVASLKRAQAAPGGAWALAGVTAIRAGEDGVVFVVRRPMRPVELAALLATPALAVTPLGRAPGAHPVGTGAFKLKKVEGRRVELESFADSWSGRPYLDGVVLRWFDDPDEEARVYEAGESDLSLRGAVGFAGHEPKYPTAVTAGPAVILHFLGFGTARPIDKQAGFRRGVSLAIARAALRHIGSGELVVPSPSPIAPDLGGPQPTASDLAAHESEARAALGAARGGPPLEILVDGTRADDLDVAARIVSALDRAGVASSYTPLAPGELARRVAAGQCDLWLGQLVPPAPTPLAALAAAFAAGGDDWLAGKLAEGPVTVEAAGAAFAARLPIVPLVHRSLSAHHKRSLRGLTIGPLGRIGWADAYFWTGPDPDATP